MSGGLLGKKFGMTQIYDDAGTCTPVTVLQVGPCMIIQKKSVDRDGYLAVQIGYRELADKKASQPYLGHFRSQKLPPYRHLKEFRVAEDSSYQVGQALSVALLRVGDTVDVTGTSKGKGFQGVIKRHGHSGGPGAHGSRFHRTPGSIGQCAFPGEVAKGTKLPGHMGSRRVTTRGLKVVQVRSEENIILVKGSVPGPADGLVFIRLSGSEFEQRAKESGSQAEQEKK